MNYPAIIAHRCGGGLAPENTLAGLVAAAGTGCRGVEFDVMLTADGVPILMHDDTLDRTTSGSGLVADHSLCQLRDVRVDGEPLPTLAEALTLCHQLGLWANIEIKPNRIGGPATAAAMAPLLACHWDGQGVVSSFDESALTEMARLAPTCPLALLVAAVPADWLDRVRRLGARGLHCAAGSLDAATVAAGTGQGLAMAAYTINDKAQADHWLAAGLSAVFTDRPELWFG